jgi:hypothetical protein
MKMQVEQTQAPVVTKKKKEKMPRGPGLSKRRNEL